LKKHGVVGFDRIESEWGATTRGGGDEWCVLCDFLLAQAKQPMMTKNRAGVFAFHQKT
jgi:hypothetical protein